MENSERISEVYSDLFKRMLGIKGELPDFLLKRYFEIKKMTDRIDGRLSSTDLARIALECGFNPETMKFEPKVLSTEQIDKKLQDTADENAVKIIPAELGKDVLGGGVPVETFEKKFDEEIKEAEQQAPAQANDFKVGDEVDVLRDDDIVDGVIVTVYVSEPKSYRIRLDDDSETDVNEKDIQAKQ